uniref:Uncharacterized protein n=1 Tax=Physcomitrium patens TaxID=3218 RepID=A0A2K1J7M3_PHYPA|nr:hypothetical protein PHYPA_020626 [Physcomitrium patens]
MTNIGSCNHVLRIDKDGANPDVVIQELSSHGLMPEEWGGDYPW